LNSDFLRVNQDTATASHKFGGEFLTVNDGAVRCFEYVDHRG
jgi:hypothetical protein